MPRLAGPHLAARVRALRPFIEVLYMSGYRRARSRTTAPLERCAFMQKPITPETLSRTVREVLDRAGGNATTRSRARDQAQSVPPRR